MKKLTLLLAGVACGALLSIPAQAGLVTVTGSYDITETYNNHTSGANDGGPTITGKYGTGITQQSAGTGTDGNFTFSVNSGSATAIANLATFNPDPNCQGPGCNGTTHTETDPFTLTITFKNGATTIGTLMENGVFEAKYSGANLPCNSSGSGGQSDCVLWGSSTGVGTDQSDTRSLTLSNGVTLSATFFDAHDWAITPQLQFTATAAAVPEPGTLALFGSAILGLGVVGWYRRRKDGMTDIAAA